MTEDAMEETAPAPTLMQKVTAEVVGTFVLVFIGCGAAVTTGADIVATGFAFGLAIVMMAYAFGRVSGGHFNPAVSVGAALAGRISWKETGIYAAAQCVGALAGGLALLITVLASDIGWEIGDPLGSNGFGDNGGVGWAGAFLFEMILTFIFLVVILGVTDERSDTVAFAPLTIGLTLAAIHFVAIPATGTSVNPARSLGVAFFSGSDAIIDLWLFLLAPLVGGALAGVLYPFLFGRASEPVPGSGFGGGGVPGLGAPNQFEQQWNQQDATHTQQQPIIQDGWMWDPAAQQWVPAPQQPAAPAAPAAPEQSAGGQGYPPPDDDGHTVIRPPQ
ncbi:aquaporin [Nocardioides sp. YIM 152588]|uniref:MIP/aquaporin family protein n=1 Tax=Nocardioides sp. YIM 152588 TaxID=3158259 RepID=UPI0032E4ED1A